MLDIKIAYVVLHYKNAAVTLKCLSHLLQIKSVNSVIVVIDNYSQNNSLNEIKAEIKRDDVVYIENGENLGFARGNNVGYTYAKNKLGANLMVVMNNDIMIEDCDFEKKLMLDIYDNQYSIIAPDIINGDGDYQNPFRSKPLSVIKLLRSTLSQTIYSLLLKFGFLPKWLAKKYSAKSLAIQHPNDDIVKNIVPHGACVIFTPKYVQSENFAFAPITFFYGEEDILYEYAKYKGLEIAYFKNLRVHHLERQSVDAISKKQIDVLRFRSINKARSLFICLKYRIFPGKFKRLFK